MSEWVTFIVTVPLVSAVLIVEVTVNDQHLISQTQSLSSTLPPLQLLGYNPQTSYEFHHKILGEDQKEATQLKGERQRQRERGGGEGREGKRDIITPPHLPHCINKASICKSSQERRHNKNI